MAAHIDVHMTGGADQPVEVATLQLLSLKLAIRVPAVLLRVLSSICAVALQPLCSGFNSHFFL
jgi:hypothetical protein